MKDCKKYNKILDALQELLDNKDIHYISVSELAQLKPVLTEIIQQGIDGGEIRFQYPAALAKIVLIILAVKMDNTLVPSTPKEIEETILGLIALLEQGAANPAGSLNFLKLF